MVCACNRSNTIFEGAGRWAKNLEERTKIMEIGFLADF